jgi:hypothetical protein
MPCYVGIACSIYGGTAQLLSQNYAAEIVVAIQGKIPSVYTKTGLLKKPRHLHMAHKRTEPACRHLWMRVPCYVGTACPIYGGTSQLLIPNYAAEIVVPIQGKMRV